MRRLSSLLFLAGLVTLIIAIFQPLPVGTATPAVGTAINHAAPEQVGAANLVTAVVLAYRGFDTLLELTILFTAAMAAGWVLDKPRNEARPDPDAGFILLAASDLLFPLLLILGLYVILHGHLTPGGGFQGGVVLALAFFLPLLARPGRRIDHQLFSLVEGLAGAAFIGIGLAAMLNGQAFLAPLFGTGELGALFSAGSLPLLYIAVGLKVGSELAGLLAHLAETEAVG